MSAKYRTIPFPFYQTLVPFLFIPPLPSDPIYHQLSHREFFLFTCDSMFHSASSHIKKTRLLNSIVRTEYPRIVLNFIDVTCQKGSNDCGLFAIAYAMSICCAKMPGKLVFDQNLMRCHLLNCLETKKIEEFPVKKEHRNSEKVTCEDAVMVHCSCRMPKTEDDNDKVTCTSCGELFHNHICVEHPDLCSLQEKWMCNNCSHK